MTDVQSNPPALLDSTVYGPDDTEIGSVSQVYTDNDSGSPTWVTVRTGWFGTSESFIPLEQATISGNRIAVPYDKDTIKGAPKFEPDEPLSPADEDELYRYYSRSGGTTGVSASAGIASDTTYDSESALGSATDAGPAAGAGYETGAATDDAMTRSEEQLHVGTERVETGRARLRKYVVTDQQTVTVPVTREEVRIEREPITDANAGEAYSGPEISEAEHEVVLTEERAVVTKEAVPVERVRLATDEVTENQTVTEEVRKEQIELDDSTENASDTRNL
jgi:uncharacterized protein (TIGR02271 family)